MSGLRYRILNLGASVGKTEVRSLNEAGQAVGAAFPAGGEDARAFVWEAGQIRDLGTLGGPFSWANGINRAGQIAGHAAVFASEETQARAFWHACLWTDGEIGDLGVWNGRRSVAFGVNDAGLVIGYAESDPSGQRSCACLWRDGQCAPLPGVEAMAFSSAWGLNTHGQIVGQFWRSMAELPHAFLVTDSSFQDLGTLGGPSSFAWAINDHGQVAGNADTPEGLRHAFLWDAGHMEDLGTLPGGDYSAARDINNSGQVVGEAFLDTDFSGRAFLWQGGQMLDLNELVEHADGWILEIAVAINNRGMIAGSGLLDGEQRSFLLIPADAG